MKTLLISVCIGCGRIYDFKWVKHFNLELIDLVVKNGERFGITISHGYCPECFAKWQGNFEKRRKHKKGGG